jgi:hypothetical protein
VPLFHSNLLHPSCTQVQATQDGGNKLPAKVFDSNFLLLVAGRGEHHGEQGWLQAGEDMCGRSRKVARFEIVRKLGFKHHQEYIRGNTRIHINTLASLSVLCNHIHIYYTHTHMHYQMCKIDLQAKSNG